MPLEIERKFLLANDDWRDAVVATHRFTDGLLARFGGGKVRVRRSDGRAWITVKGARSGISRAEYEYEIPTAEADEMLLTLCDGPPVEKIRHCVPHAGLVWSVDVHLGPLAGIAFAEVELQHPDQALPLPPWVGPEITHDPRYRKETLLRRCAEALDPAAG